MPLSVYYMAKVCITGLRFCVSERWIRPRADKKKEEEPIADFKSSIL